MKAEGKNKDPTQRFSSRVENYIRYRPDYPPAIIPFLERECGFLGSNLVADIGSGTGKLTELFLKHGNRVIGIEPNREMREAAERLLVSYPLFQSINAAAEATGLEMTSVDMITAGQAFHWFDREKARREFLRILKPGGWLALIWNDRNISARPFFQAYENLLLTYGTDYEKVGHKHADAQMIGSFFGDSGFKLASFPNEQVFNFEGLQGRLMSSSYAPEAGHLKHAPMVEALAQIFKEHQKDGKVTFEYDTTLYYGRLR
ncbi:MAG TPA: class I SAM-dependent methyltransferase [Verrucomicrobiae bacterium]|nr:class I SAM-dependent methyltransferase [Verrucomicrobiae bacterium]